MEGIPSDPFTEAFSPKMAFRRPFMDWIAVGIYLGAITSFSVCFWCSFVVRNAEVEMFSCFIHRTC